MVLHSCRVAADALPDLQNHQYHQVMHSRRPGKALAATGQFQKSALCQQSEIPLYSAEGSP